MDYDKQGIKDVFNVSVALGDVWINLGFHTTFDKTTFGALRMDQISNPSCLFTPFESLGFNDEDLSMGAFEAQIHAALVSLKKEPHRLDKTLNGTKITGLVEQVRVSTIVLCVCIAAYFVLTP